MGKVYDLTSEFDLEKRPIFIRNVPLDGKNYEIQYRFNTVEQAWYLDFLGIIYGAIKLVIGIDLLEQFQALNLPQGTLYAVLMNKYLDISQPNYKQLGSDVKLLYTSPD